MFGYVKPDSGELKVKEYELYKSFYCGLCRRMGKCVCRDSSLTLSYDIVFLALIRAALEDDVKSVSPVRCIAHPIKKRTAVDGCPSLDYSARAGSLLACYNIFDDVRDKKGLRRLGAASLLPYAKKLRKRADLSELDAVVSKKLEELSQLEKNGDTSLDQAADVFGELLGEVFCHRLDNPKKSRVAYEAGYHTGRYIYIIDAADDLESDLKTGSYNSLAKEECIEDSADKLRTSLRLELEAIAVAVELIEFSDDGIKHIVENIIYSGMANRAEPEAMFHRKKERILN